MAAKQARGVPRLLDWAQRKLNRPAAVEAAQPTNEELVRNGIAGILKDKRIFRKALTELLRENNWSADQFAEYCLAPTGLGVATPESFELVRDVLVAEGLFEELTALLLRASLLRGRPRKSLAPGETFLRFWTPSRAGHGLDRILLKLHKKHPDYHHQVCTHELLPNEAARAAGIIRSQSDSRLTFQRCLEFCAKLRARALGNFLCELFRSASIDAQCALLSRELEPKLGQPLARQWRTIGDLGSERTSP
jgi:hypothetical protein